MIALVTDYLLGKAPLGAARSKGWAAVRKEHLSLFPFCEVCGSKVALEAHHIEPFHLRPDLELAPSNLMTLCERKKYGINCHLLVGHLGNYRRINTDARTDASVWRRKLILP